MDRRHHGIRRLLIGGLLVGFLTGSLLVSLASASVYVSRDTAACARRLVRRHSSMLRKARLTRRAGEERSQSPANEGEVSGAAILRLMPSRTNTIADPGGMFDSQWVELIRNARFPRGFSPAPIENRKVYIAKSKQQLDAWEAALTCFDMRYASTGASMDGIQIAMANGIYGRELLEAFTFDRERKLYGDDEAYRRMAIRLQGTTIEMKDVTQERRARNRRHHELFDGNPYQSR